MAINEAPEEDYALEKLQRVLGGSIVERKQRTVTGNTVWHWSQTSALQLRTVVPRLLPHLTIKKPKALLVLELAERMVSGNGGKGLTIEELQSREHLYERFKELR